ncbi:MAG: zinc-binding dehydrogenase [Chloroflexi bacterium]|nr:zinc-binding dehydrogenase [Chloroflexota bacterium]
MNTTAAVLVAINRSLQIEQLKVPPLKTGQVLVEIAYSGICHSQLNEIHGLKGEDKFLPHTLGHEGSGIVIETGPDVTKVKPGDPVVLTWIKGSGCDAPSTQYVRRNGTFVNSGAISTFMTHAVISENRLVTLSKTMPLKEAALLGCAIPTGAGIVKNSARIQPGQSVAIFGLGGIGLSALLMAGHINREVSGRQNINDAIIVAIDVSDDKLSLARQMGATHTINARIQNPLDALMSITAGQGVHYAIEAAGQRTVMEQAFRSVRDKGGLCILAGNLPQGETISIDPFNLIKGKRIAGTWGGETDPDQDIPFYEESFLANRMDFRPFIHSTSTLHRINDAIHKMETGQVGRCLVDMKLAQCNELNY